MGLIYQSNIKTSAAQINLGEGSRVIHEIFACRQSHHTNDHTLINVSANNNRYLNITPLKINNLETLPVEFTTWRNITQPKRGNALMKEKLSVLLNHQLTLCNCKQLY